MKTNNDKVDPRILRSKAALCDALLTLMAHKPFAAITITEIVKQSEYNRSTFYANYSTKEELLNDMIDRKIEDLLYAFRAPYQNVKEFYPHELHAQSVLIFDHISHNAEFYTVLTNSDVLPTLQQKMFLSLKRILAEELIQGTRDLDQELAITYSLSALLGLIFHWISSGFAYKTSYMQDQLVKIINHHKGTAKLMIQSKI
jgi:AcrR family transcriptional regulator